MFRVFIFIYLSSKFIRRNHYLPVHVISQNSSTRRWYSRRAPLPPPLLRQLRAPPPPGAARAQHPSSALQNHQRPLVVGLPDPAALQPLLSLPLHQLTLPPHPLVALSLLPQGQLPVAHQAHVPLELPPPQALLWVFISTAYPLNPFL